MRRAGSDFLGEAQCCVKEEQAGDHRRFDIFAQRDLDDHCSLEHPRHGRPEFREVRSPSRGRFLGNDVRPECAETAASFGARQADRSRALRGDCQGLALGFEGHIASSC